MEYSPRKIKGKLDYWGWKEVSFLQVGKEVILIEVKNSTKLSGGFPSFLRVYKLKCAIVFTEKEFGIKKVNNTKVAFILHYYI